MCVCACASVDLWQGRCHHGALPCRCVCWESLCNGHVSGEDLPGSFEKPCICLYRPRGRWAPAIKYGLLIPQIYVYTFTRIPHSFNKYSVGANKMQGSGPGSEASKMSKVVMANLSLSSLQMSVMGNSSRHLITSTADPVPGIFYPLSHLSIISALQGMCDDQRRR